MTTDHISVSVTDLCIQCFSAFFHVHKNQTQATEKQIKEEFEQLREFLQREETARLAALKQEDEEKKELVKRKSDSITSAILTFSHAIIAIENEIASSDALFLKVIKFLHIFLSDFIRPRKQFVILSLLISELCQHKEKVTAFSSSSSVQKFQFSSCSVLVNSCMCFSSHRAQIPHNDPGKVSGALINVAKHVSSLKFHVWEKMVELVQYSMHSLDSVFGNM